jgi:hypothetical protein
LSRIYKIIDNQEIARQNEKLYSLFSPDKTYFDKDINKKRRGRWGM